MTVIPPTQLDRAAGRLCVAETPRGIRALKHQFVVEFVVLWRPAKVERRNFLELAPRVHGTRVIGTGPWRGWSGCRPTNMSTADPCWYRPHTTSTLSQGIANVSAATRARSVTECVPRLPTPDCTYSLPSLADRHDAVPPNRPRTMRTHGDTPRRALFDPLRLPRSCFTRIPVEPGPTAIERFFHESTSRVGACPVGLGTVLSFPFG